MTEDAKKRALEAVDWLTRANDSITLKNPLVQKRIKELIEAAFVSHPDDALELAFKRGFDCSGEGFNGEYGASEADIQKLWLKKKDGLRVTKPTSPTEGGE